MSANGGQQPGRVLLVEDEKILVKVLTRVLSAAELQVESCSSGASAIAALRGGSFDLVISDIGLFGMTGIELLRAIRDVDDDLPVVLMTGAPTIETAAKAVEYGALKYLLKPISDAELVDTATKAVKLHRLARIKSQMLALLGTGTGAGAERVGLEAAFERALAGFWMAFQPIVNAKDRTTFGYEALLRSEEPVLPNPAAILDAAERLSQIPRLGKLVRERAALAMTRADPAWRLFVNLHPEDLADPELDADDAPLSGISRRVVLEVTERSSLDRILDVRGRVASLRLRGFQIAIDDLGAGYSGLASFVHLEPEFVKLDMSLVRDVDSNPVKQKLVRSMTTLAKDMGLTVVAEGVETPGERDCLVDLGTDLLQGYLFGKPARPFAIPSWQ